MISNEMKKPMKKMIIAVGILFGAIFIYKGIHSFFRQHFFSSQMNPIITVSSAKATLSTWEAKIKAVGGLRATLGVNVTSQLGGMIETIYFTPGAFVTEGTVLVEQNTDPNVALLHSLEANAELAKITYERDQAQFKVKSVSKQQLDTDLQNLKSLLAQVAQQKAIIDQLVIKAPFTGRLGISNVNPGQYLNPGDTVVTLQSLDPIYVDFYLPQEALVQLNLKQQVTVELDSFKKSFTGKITT